MKAESFPFVVMVNGTSEDGWEVLKIVVRDTKPGFSSKNIVSLAKSKIS